MNVSELAWLLRVSQFNNNVRYRFAVYNCMT